MSVSSESVVAFLTEFEALAEKEDFSLIERMIDENAFLRFNDGDFVGRPAIRAAFERTWRGDPTIKKACFYLTDIVVVATDECSASATYTYNWEGAQGDPSSRFVVAAPASCSPGQAAFVSSTST